MKKKVVSIVTLSLAAMLSMGGLSSCNTKQHAINRLEKFSVELRDHSAQYSVNEWKKARKSASSKANAPATWRKV